MRVTVTVVLAVSSAALAQDPDEVSLALARARSVEKCSALYAPAKKSFPAAIIRGVSTDAAACTRRVMNAELDRVLLPLKKSDPAKFKLGMDAQRLFNEAVKRYCGRWEDFYAACCSTCSYTEEPECEMDFHAARVAMAGDALAGRAPPEVGAARRERLLREFSGFADAWCRFLRGDEACTARVLGALEAKQRDAGADLKCR